MEELYDALYKEQKEPEKPTKPDKKKKEKPPKTGNNKTKLIIAAAVTVAVGIAVIAGVGIKMKQPDEKVVATPTPSVKDEITATVAAELTPGLDQNTVIKDQNRIIGIEENGFYTTKSKISFTAVGAGMGNFQPKEGDIRYVPLNWTVVNTNSWSKAPYTACFGLSRGGYYILKVVFKQQKYATIRWEDTGEQDEKQVPFVIYNEATFSHKN